MNEKIWEDEGQQKKAYLYLVVIIYDISDNRRRANFGKKLKAFGQRIQRSSFECHLNEAKYNKLLRLINDFYQPDDQIRVYRLAGNTKVEVWGDEGSTEEDDSLIFI